MAEDGVTPPPAGAPPELAGAGGVSPRAFGVGGPAAALT